MAIGRLTQASIEALANGTATLTDLRRIGNSAILAVHAWQNASPEESAAKRQNLDDLAYALAPIAASSCPSGDPEIRAAWGTMQSMIREMLNVASPGTLALSSGKAAMFGIGLAVLIVGGGLVWYIRKKRRR